MRLDNRGFSLVELIVVTVIFVMVIIITGDVFKTILTQNAKLHKSEESNIEGVVGLEMLRHDLEQAGFGLPYSFQSTITYTEAGFAPANNYNDAPSFVPRAFVTDNDLSAPIPDTNSTNGGSFTILKGTDYLAIKASTLGGNDASQKWTYLTYSSLPIPAKTWSSGNFQPGDNLIMLSRTFDSSGYTNQLVCNPPNYSVSYSSNGYAAPFAPSYPGEIFYAYGINSGGTSVGMPFNRVDYFVASPPSSQLSSACADTTKTGILYKAMVNHSGKLTYIPLLDCVADMQIVLGWDLADSSGNLVSDPSTSGDGQIDTWTNADGSNYTSSVTVDPGDYVQKTILPNPGHIRTKLKLIKVYILAQNGRKDSNYTSPTPISIGDKTETTLVRPGGYPLTANMLNYRWKVYRLVIKPKNLISNQ